MGAALDRLNSAWVISNEQNVVVNTVIGSGHKAKHYRHRYEHHSEYERQKQAGFYMRSGARDFYLGDWHMHPGGRACMNWVDRKTLAAIARKGETILGPITLILGEPH